MGRIAFFILSLAFAMAGWKASAQNTATLRELFFASDSEVEVAVFAKVSAKQNQTMPINLAYTGVSAAMQAEYASGPWNKLRFFNDGKKALEKAISMDPFNPEIRFLRFSIQSNIPALLMYSGDLDKDLLLIEQYLKSTPDIETGFWIKALNVMLLAENASETQRKRIGTLLFSLS